MKDREQYNAYMREYGRKRYRQRRQDAIKSLGGKCVDCGTTENLEFDHEDASTKKFAIAKILNYGAKAKIEEELKKCVLRCKTCHVRKSIEVGDLPPRATHGTSAMYQHHDCRCEACVEANSRDQKRWREKRKGVSHG